MLEVWQESASPFFDLSSFKRVLPPFSKLPAAGHPFLTLNVLIAYIPSTFIDSSGFIEPVQIPSNHLYILKVIYTSFTSFVAFIFSCLFKHFYGAEIRTWTLEFYFYSATALPSCILMTITAHVCVRTFTWMFPASWFKLGRQWGRSLMCMRRCWEQRRSREHSPDVCLR